jgi:hypothetical protein
MKKRTLVITLTTGQQIQQDLTQFIKAMQTNTAIPAHDRLPLNPPATHEAFKGLCTSIMVGGVEAPNTSGKDYMQYIGPSQIKTVEIIFTDN